MVQSFGFRLRVLGVGPAFAPTKLELHTGSIVSIFKKDAASSGPLQ